MARVFLRFAGARNGWVTKEHVLCSEGQDEFGAAQRASNGADAPSAYKDSNDVQRVSVDPAMRHMVGGRARERQAASTS
jgi:hypothetical protein